MKHPNPKESATNKVVREANLTGERFEVKEFKEGDEIIVTAINPKTEQPLTDGKGRPIREPYRSIIGVC